MTTDFTVLTDPFIWVYEDAIPEKKCQEIIEKFEAFPHKTQGSTGGGVNLLVKNSTDCMVSGYDYWSDIDKEFEGLIGFLIERYCQHLEHSITGFSSFVTGDKTILGPPIYENVYDTGYQIQRTEVGKGYTWHHDWRPHRVLTYILYLNTVEEGWTQFYNGDQVSPKAGRCVIFPATWTYYHQGYPPKETKYLMTGWVHND